MTTRIQTKFGTASLNKSGHYVIRSGKEGNHNKMLHRLIFEDFYQITLPRGLVVHHEDGNKTNNEIWNLIPMTKEEHISYHNRLREYSEKSKEKQSNTLSHRINKSGYYRVSKRVNTTLKQGFLWRYTYVQDGKRKEIASISLSKLKEKVVAKGLEWKILDKVKAMESDCY